MHILELVGRRRCRPSVYPPPQRPGAGPRRIHRRMPHWRLPAPPPHPAFSACARIETAWGPGAPEPHLGSALRQDPVLIPPAGMRSNRRVLARINRASFLGPSPDPRDRASYGGLSRPSARHVRLGRAFRVAPGHWGQSGSILLLGASKGDSLLSISPALRAAVEPCPLQVTSGPPAARQPGQGSLARPAGAGPAECSTGQIVPSRAAARHSESEASGSRQHPHERRRLPRRHREPPVLGPHGLLPFSNPERSPTAGR